MQVVLSFTKYTTCFNTKCSLTDNILNSWVAPDEKMITSDS